MLYDNLVAFVANASVWFNIKLGTEVPKQWVLTNNESKTVILVSFAGSSGSEQRNRWNKGLKELYLLPVMSFFRIFSGLTCRCKAGYDGGSTFVKVDDLLERGGEQ